MAKVCTSVMHAAFFGQAGVRAARGAGFTLFWGTQTEV